MKLIPQRALAALLSEMHGAIRDSADHFVDEWSSADLSYPPGSELSADERAALDAVKLGATARSALRRLITDACAAPIYHLFSMFDGEFAPDGIAESSWPGVRLTVGDPSESTTLADDFFDGAE